MPNDRDAKCPGCGETTLGPNEFHSGLKIKKQNINGIGFQLIYCANCGTIIGVTRETVS